MGTGIDDRPGMSDDLKSQFDFKWLCPRRVRFPDQAPGIQRPLSTCGRGSREESRSGGRRRADGRRPSRSPAPSAGSPRRKPGPPRDRRAWPGEAPTGTRGSPSGDGGFRTKAPRSRRGGTGLRPGSTVRPVPRSPGGNGRPRRRCRPASGAFSAPAPADRSKMPLGSAETREPAGALPGDQRLQGGAHGGGLLPDPRKLLGLPQEFIVDVQRRSHMHQYASYMHTGQPGKVESTRVVGSDLPHQASAYRTGATVAVASPGEGEDRLEVNRKVGESGLGRLEYLGWIDVVVLVDD